MKFEEDGERIKDLQVILSRVVNAAMLFDDDGISIRFMNDWIPEKQRDGLEPRDFDGIRSEQMIQLIVDRLPFKGLTPLGTQLRAKVLEPMVLGPARNGQLPKPVLVITITDGQPAGESQNSVHEAIMTTSSELSRMPRYGKGAVSFQFAQVGNDQKAKEFLAKLDSDPQVGTLVDCTSSE